MPGLRLQLLAAACLLAGCRASVPASDAPEAPRFETAPSLAKHSRAGKLRDYFPDTRLTTHEGEEVRFYEDLVKGKVVMINLMYTTCTGT